MFVFISLQIMFNHVNVLLSIVATFLVEFYDYS